MDVNGTSGVGGVGPAHNEPVKRPAPTEKPADASAASGKDRADITPDAQRLEGRRRVAEAYNDAVDKLPGVRQDKVERARQLLRDRELDTPDRIKKAVASLLAEHQELEPIIDKIEAAQRVLDRLRDRPTPPAS